MGQRRLQYLVIVLLAFSGCGGGAPDIRPLNPDSVIVAFGDSLTSGEGAAREQSYPAVLATLTGCRVINAGVPGEVSAAGLKRLPLVLKEHKPDLVILCHGGNDLLKKSAHGPIEANLEAMIEMARTAGADVILIAVPERKFPIRPAKFYANLAERHRIPCDTKSIAGILSSPKLRSDYAHPNEDGYRLLAETLAEVIE